VLIRIRAKETIVRNVARTMMMIRKDLKSAEDQGPAAVVAVLTAGEVASIPNVTRTRAADAAGEDTAIHLTVKTSLLMMRTGSNRRRRNH